MTEQIQNVWSVVFCRFTINLIIALNQLPLDLTGTSLSRYGKCGEREASSHVSPQLLWEKLMDMKDYSFFFFFFYYYCYFTNKSRLWFVWRSNKTNMWHVACIPIQRAPLRNSVWVQEALRTFSNVMLLDVFDMTVSIHAIPVYSLTSGLSFRLMNLKSIFEEG